MKILDLILTLHQLHNANGNLEVFVQDGLSPSDFMPVVGAEVEPGSNVFGATDKEVLVLRA